MCVYIAHLSFSKKVSMSSGLFLMFYTVNLLSNIFIVTWTFWQVVFFFFFYLSRRSLFLCMKSLTVCVLLCFLINFPKDSPGDLLSWSWLLWSSWPCSYRLCMFWLHRCTFQQYLKIKCIHEISTGLIQIIIHNLVEVCAVLGDQREALDCFMYTIHSFVPQIFSGIIIVWIV